MQSKELAPWAEVVPGTGLMTVDDLMALPDDGLRLPYGPAPLHVGELRLPVGAGPHPVVVSIHGGFWRAAYDRAHMDHLCAALTAVGAATWNVEYRRIGDSGGGWPGTFHDVALAADHVRTLAPRYNLDLARVVTLGFSAGGHLALWLAARGRIPPGDPLHDADPLLPRAAVALAGVVDLRRAWELRLSDGVVQALMGGAPAERQERYATASPAALLPLGLPQLLVHGTADDSVPYEISRAYHAAALDRGDTVQLITLPGADHFALIDPTSHAWPSIAAAVLPLLDLASP